MGLFNFFKKSGSKAKKPAEPSPEALKKATLSHIEALLQMNAFDIEGLQLDLVDDKAIVKGKVDSQEIREKVILTVGNVDGVASVEDHIEVEKPEPEAVFYEVKSGDSLSKIAKAHYGDAMKYTVIFEANKPMLSDPDKIYPGQMLRIPAIEKS